MQNPLSISTGYIYRLIKSGENYEDNAIKYLKGLPIDGVELCIANKERLNNFNPSKETIDFLKGLKYNSIHAPWDVQINSSVESEMVLEKIKAIYKEINAHNVTFHDHHVKDYKQILKYDFSSSIENCDDKGFTLIKAKEILESNPGLGFTYDLAHDYKDNPKNTLGFLNEFKERIVECHVSIINQQNNEYNHWFMYQSRVNELLKEFAKKVPNVPLVNETVVWDLNQINYFEKELDYTRSL